MPTYTHREHVLTAFNHQEPDRIPVQLDGQRQHAAGYDFISGWGDALGLTPIPPVQSGTTANYYDERILEILNVDFRPHLP